MSTPPRRHSRGVYRRRRLLVVLIAALVTGGIVWAVLAQPWRPLIEALAPEPTASVTPTPGPSVSTQATPDPETPAASGEPTTESTPGSTAPAVTACSPQDVLVEPVTDKDSYAAGEQPQLRIRLTNQGATDCTMNVGTNEQSLTITSGNDVWWRSTDCQVEPSAMVVTLAAGQVVESAEPIVWDRTRSSVSTCDSERPRAPGGGASFHLSVAIGGIEGLGSKQILLY